MLTTVVVLLLLLAAAVAPDGRLGQALIQTPARLLARLSWWNAALGVLPALAVIGLVVLAPEIVVLFGMADLAVFALVGVPALLLGAGALFTRLRRRIAVTLGWTASVAQRAAVSRRWARTRPRRHRPQSRGSGGADEPDWAFA